MKLFQLIIVNGLTLVALYFLVASRFIIVFGIINNFNMPDGALYLLRACIGFEMADVT